MCFIKIWGNLFLLVILSVSEFLLVEWLSPGHVRQDLWVDEREGVHAVQVVQVVPLVEGNLVVVEHVGQGGHQAENVLKN